MSSLTELAQDFTSFVPAEMARLDVPGVVVGVVHGDERVVRPFGVASIETGFPVRADTLFQWGSISKLHTTTKVMHLVDEDILDLDVPVQHFLPEFRLATSEAGQTLSLRHVLTHTGGFHGDHFVDYGPCEDAVFRALAQFPSLHQYAPPGAVWAYANTGFQVAAAVIQRMRARAFEDAVRECLLAPLGLEHTFYFADDVVTHPVATGHNKVQGQSLELTRVWARHRARNGNGGLTGSMDDLLTFAAFHLGDGTAGGKRVLSRASLTEMREGLVSAGCFAEGYGLGWRMQQYGDTRVYGHGGSTNGFRAELQCVPEQHFAVAVLTNSNTGSHLAEAVTNRVLEQALGLRRTAPTSLPLPDSALQRFAGRYRRPGNDLTVTIANGGLRLAWSSSNVFTKEALPATVMRADPVAAALPLTGAVDTSSQLPRFLLRDGPLGGQTVDILPEEDGTVRFLRMDGRLYQPERE